jgi:hypothetical protein
MNLPGTTGGEDSWIDEQRSHGESIPEHFSVKTTPQKPRSGRPVQAKSCQRYDEMLPKAPVCPLSVQLGKKTDAQNPQLN